MTTLTQEQLTAAKQFCHFLAWDNPELAEQCFAEFEVSLLQNEPSFELFDHLRMAVEPVCAFVDWNELDFLLTKFQQILNAHNIAITLNIEDYDLDDPESFFMGIQGVLCEHDLEVWMWDTSMSMYCAFITRSEDYQINSCIKLLGFDKGSHKTTNLAQYCC